MSLNLYHVENPTVYDDCISYIIVASSEESALSFQPYCISHYIYPHIRSDFKVTQIGIALAKYHAGDVILAEYRQE